MRWSHMRVGPTCQGGDLEDSPLLLSITLDPEKWCPSAGFHFIHKILPLGGPSHSKDFCWWHDQKNHSPEKWITWITLAFPTLGLEVMDVFVIILYIFIFVFIIYIYLCLKNVHMRIPHSTHPRSQL